MPGLAAPHMAMHPLRVKPPEFLEVVQKRNPPTSTELRDSACPGQPSSIKDPNATFADRVVHRIRREIGAIWPLNRAQDNLSLIEYCRIA